MFLCTYLGIKFKGSMPGRGIRLEPCLTLTNICPKKQKIKQKLRGTLSSLRVPLLSRNISTLHNSYSFPPINEVTIKGASFHFICVPQCNWVCAFEYLYIISNINQYRSNSHLRASCPKFRDTGELLRCRRRPWSR